MGLCRPLPAFWRKAHNFRRQGKEGDRRSQKDLKPEQGQVTGIGTAWERMRKGEMARWKGRKRKRIRVKGRRQKYRELRERQRSSTRN